MKPHQKTAELRRKVARLARQVPDNAAFVNLVMANPEQKRVQFYRSVAPFLKFTPVSLVRLLNGNADA